MEGGMRTLLGCIACVQAWKAHGIVAICSGNSWDEGVAPVFFSKYWDLTLVIFVPLSRVRTARLHHRACDHVADQSRKVFVQK